MSDKNEPLDTLDDSVAAPSWAVHEQKCPNCNAPIIFNPKSGKIECAWCGMQSTVNEFKRIKPKADRKERDRALGTMKPLPIYRCRSCDAQLISSPESGAMTCPYCQNNIVLTEQFSGTIQPDGIVPFRIQPRNLASAVRRFYKGKTKLPFGLMTKWNIGPVTGIYVPFWLFDCDVAGDISFAAEKFQSTYFRDSQRFEETGSYLLKRTVTMSFADLAIDASKKFADDLMDSVQPFDFEDIRPFDVQYLAGFVADRFDQTSDEIRNRCEERVMNTAVKTTIRNATAGFSNVHVRSNHLGMTIRQARYVLLPVYLFSVTLQNQTHHFAMNGQTGRVIGKVPHRVYSDGQWFTWGFSLGFAIVAALLYFFFVR